MEYRKIMIKNGEMTIPYYIYKCKKCGSDIEEAHPNIEKNGEMYCWNCAFIEGFISEKEYLSLLCTMKNARAVIHDGKIFIGFGKFPWERTNRDRNCKEYKDWRNEVFERDNYTCQMCGKRGGVLNAHHIKAYKSYPKLRYSVKNGMTLCEKCHKSIHRKKGADRIE